MNIEYHEYEQPKKVGYKGYINIGKYTFFRGFDDKLVVFQGTKNTGIVFR